MKARRNSEVNRACYVALKNIQEYGTEIFCVKYTIITEAADARNKQGQEKRIHGAENLVVAVRG